MTAYIIKLLLLLPVMGGLIFAALWLYCKYQPALMNAQKERRVKILETLPMGGFAKLAVIEFDGQMLLISVNRTRIDRLAAGAEKP
ncbi:flagellar biosynthetic protein FliO [Parasphingorhabdus cellanae]|uniref:Flagellar biosynthetic protein FliO n=2 Tax=Parasphingorhabdus cellanae TaxID=2806553 RepID=A0ABX7TB88_9SPHN|nr:flagellar biosynthetic protein FliO [Parasphingorhabdus cellanae]